MSEQQISLQDIPVQQLVQVKAQLDQEIETLTNAFHQLKAAEAKFKGAMKSLSALPTNKGKEMLIPLTSSLYVPGKITDAENVKVDVGAGYFVEKTVKEAKTYYNTKILDLRSNLDQLKAAIESKQENRQMVNSTIQRRLLEQQGQEGAQQASA